MVRAILESRASTELGFVLHWVDDPVLLPASTVRERDIDAETMGRIAGDRLYLFRR